MNYVCIHVGLSYGFRLGKSTVCSILKETCDVIWDVLGKEFFKAPSSVDEWKNISRDLYMKWNIPNCIGMYMYTLFIHKE